MLGILFKFFSKYIVKDIKNVYILFSSLLSDKNKEHIRKFACESFASLIRKGHQTRFSEIIKQVFKQLLEFLGLEDLSHLVEESLLQMLTSMATHTVQNHCVAVQETFSDILVELISEIQCSENKDDKIKHLTCILRLLHFWILFKNGKLITPENKLTNVAVLLSGLKDLPTYCMTSVVELISSIMLNDCLKLPIDKVKTIISQVSA
ncbi:small subunit processome component 20 [Caerostris extrusa]|uniref:Small subunit processome component 20 n=1 Tax=Caerostris extrusa TaxID=172846 RepID=A0AAV4MG86_CAEEX|nr:small subunit processome component 20 [Caerostris extrusa]